MLKLWSFGSSSSGNSFLLYDGFSYILLDAGVDSITLKQKLFDLNLSKKDIKGILITHGHQDHIKSLNLFNSSKYFMTRGTCNESINKYNYSKSNVKIIIPNIKYKVGSYEFMALEEFHDSQGPVSYIIKNKSGEKFVYITDTGDAKNYINNADFYLIESNHLGESLNRKINKLESDEFGDKNKLKLFRRIKNNHLSVEQTIKYLKDNMGNHTKQIVLMHMSPTNIHPTDSVMKVRGELGFKNVDYVHPLDHKLEKCWEIGYRPRKLEV